MSESEKMEKECPDLETWRSHGGHVLEVETCEADSGGGGDITGFVDPPVSDDDAERLAKWPSDRYEPTADGDDEATWFESTSLPPGFSVPDAAETEYWRERRRLGFTVPPDPDYEETSWNSRHGAVPPAGRAQPRYRHPLHDGPSRVNSVAQPVQASRSSNRRRSSSTEGTK